MPICVIAGEVKVGECAAPPGEAQVRCCRRPIAFARPKSSTFTVPPRGLHVRRLEIAVNDPLLVGRFERLGDLPRHWQRLVERHRAPREPLRQVLAIHELHRQRTSLTP